MNVCVLGWGGFLESCFVHCNKPAGIVKEKIDEVLVFMCQVW